MKTKKKESTNTMYKNKDTPLDPMDKQNKCMQKRWNKFWSNAVYKTLTNATDMETDPMPSIQQRIHAAVASMGQDVKDIADRLQKFMPERKNSNITFCDALESLRHNDTITLEERPKGTKWRVDYNAKPCVDNHHRKLAPTYGAWNLEGIQDSVNFLRAIAPILTPALADCLGHVFKYIPAYNHGERYGNSKPLVCTVWKNMELSHYELYISTKKMVEQRGNKRHGTKGYNISASTISKIKKNGECAIICGKGYEGTICIRGLEKP